MILQTCFYLLIGNSFAAPVSQDLSKRVIALRQEVELLNDDYKLEREKILNEMKALSIEKAELASQIRSEQIRRDQLREKIGGFKQSISQSSVESQELLPIVEEFANSLRTHIKTSLPFKTTERLESLKRLNEKLKAKEISAVKATNQLWGLFEDEKRLARDTSLHRQTLPIDQGMHLAEVAKVGMLFMYFKTDQNKVGMAKRQGESWSYHVFDQPEQESMALNFMESLKKQIRQGYFKLPVKRGIL